MFCPFTGLAACRDGVIAYNSWGSGGAVSPPAGPGQSPGRGPGGSAPGSSWDYTIYEALKWLHEKNYAPKKVGGHGPPGFAGNGKLCKRYDDNLQRSFRNHTLETGFSDFHLMIYTMLKTKFNKAPPKIIKNGEYNRFSEANVFTDLSIVTRETPVYFREGCTH